MIGEKIPVQIYNRSVEIDAEGLTPLEVNALANYVTEKMKEIEAQTKIVDSGKLAMLAAINIADELFNLKKQKETYSHLDEKKLEEFLNTLQSALKEA
ncbi:MAG: cell division protein ZapA [Elusimicrobia bacterium]|nr:cell division protein ZapA [Elusimicrobiota bacterium]